MEPIPQYPQVTFKKLRIPYHKIASIFNKNHILVFLVTKIILSFIKKLMKKKTNEKENKIYVNLDMDFLNYL